MTNLTPYLTPPTVSAIFKRYQDASDPPRLHLGASQIGHHCDRFLWYAFRWCEYPSFDGRMLRLFDHGNWEEQRLVADLRAIGVTVMDVDPDTGRQWTFTAFGGHFGCSLDGVAHGFKESPKWHNLEFKTFNDKSFQVLKKKGMEQTKPIHHAQVQAGMELADLERTYYFAVNKNTDAIHGERIHRKHKEGARLLDRAERVIFSPEPLEKISERPDWYECKYCDMYRLCHQDGVAEANCRTCVHSTPERNGTWSCAAHNKTLTEQEQRDGCDRHLLIPALVGRAKPVDAGDDYIEYQNPDGGTWRNGQPADGSYASREVRASEALPLAADLEDLRSKFSGEIVG